MKIRCCRVELWISDLFFILMGSFITRFYKICDPDVVCWDETHFGKFASFYLKSENYFDVHPPLGKMMLAMFGGITGYNGTFPFEEPGQEYGETSYCGMRVCCALLGALIPPMAYTVVKLQVSRQAGMICACLLICDVGLITLTQFILLESPLFFFLSTTIVTHQLTRSLERYSKLWFCSMALAGLSIGCIISVKYIGVFTVLYTGFMVIEDIWRIASNKDSSIREVIKYFGMFAIFLILIPLTLYLVFFALHFHYTITSSEADATYSPTYQASLLGNKISEVENSRFMRYQNTVRLKSGQFLLHSHHLTYPDINLNQVTGYSHRDENNEWVVEKCLESGFIDSVITAGDAVQLRHKATGRYITTVPRFPAVSNALDFRVATTEQSDLNSCYQITTANSVQTFQKMEIFQQDIILLSINNKCALSMGDSQLPEYGAKQLEVSCTRRYLNNPPSVLFTLEQNLSLYPDENTERVKPSGFFDKLAEMQVKMLVTNNALLPSETEQSSRPWMWPINYEGLWFGITEKHGGIYFLGNPVIFWINLAMILVLVYINIQHSYILLRDKVSPYSSPLLHQTNWYLLGYLLHYIPFFLMGRVLYFHHFYSAFIFNTMLTAGVLDLVLGKEDTRPERVVRAVFVCLCVGSFLVFSPLAYGIPVDENKQTYGYVKKLKWLNSWGF